MKTLAVLWTVSQNCFPWQFYGPFSAQQEIGEKISAKELPYRAVSQNCLPWQFYGSFSDQQENGHLWVTAELPYKAVLRSGS